MRITILAFGSRGDVQPYVALGLGLQRAGHKVRLAALSQFKAFVESRGLDFFSLGIDMRDLRKAGVAPQIIARAVEDGEIERISRGLYQYADADNDATLAYAGRELARYVGKLTGARPAVRAAGRARRRGRAADRPAAVASGRGARAARRVRAGDVDASSPVAPAMEALSP